MVPVLLRDSRRLADAQRCRPGRPPSRVQLMRVATSGMLDRALDVAAALEVRGYGAARRPPSSRRAYSRHDLAFAGSALGVAAVAIGMRAGGLPPFNAYPALRASAGVDALLASGALIACALAPFADRRGVQ
jgi:energy-coupling factor transport system permease protein